MQHELPRRYKVHLAMSHRQIVACHEMHQHYLDVTFKRRRRRSKVEEAKQLAAYEHATWGCSRSYGPSEGYDTWISRIHIIHYQQVYEQQNCVHEEEEEEEEEKEETLFDPKSANVQCITYQIYAHVSTHVHKHSSYRYNNYKLIIHFGVGDFY